MAILRFEFYFLYKDCYHLIHRVLGLDFYLNNILLFLHDCILLMVLCIFHLF